MKVLVTGNEGYIGSVVTAVLAEARHEVTGLDIGIFREAQFVPRRGGVKRQIYQDVRDLGVADLQSYDAIIHLAGLSNDPLGQLNPEITYAINHRASVRLAMLAKAAGVKRFLFSSSCSLYGIAGEELVNEYAPLQPRTAYAESKAWVERDVAALATDSFTPVFLRNATVFGLSPRLRLDLVVQNLTASGFLTQQIEVLSDGTPWRPLVHVEDVASAFTFLLTAPQALVHNQPFNVGSERNTLQVKAVAHEVSRQLPGSRVAIRQLRSGDERSYRVDFSKMTALGWKARVSVAEGIAELLTTFRSVGFSAAHLQLPLYSTLKRYEELLADGTLNDQLRLTTASPAQAYD